MENLFDNIKINKQTWNNKTDVQIISEFYDNENFLKEKSAFKAIEFKFLGDIKNKKILHLKCHFGQDSWSLSRLGAQVTGNDLSDKAILKAKDFKKNLISMRLFLIVIFMICLII